MPDDLLPDVEEVPYPEDENSGNYGKRRLLKIAVLLVAIAVAIALLASAGKDSPDIVDLTNQEPEQQPKKKGGKKKNA